MRFNHIINIRQGINSTTRVVPFLYTLFKLLAGLTNFHNNRILLLMRRSGFRQDTPSHRIRRHTRFRQKEPGLNFNSLISNYYANVSIYEKIDSSIRYYCIQRKSPDSFLIIDLYVVFIFNYINYISLIILYFDNISLL